MESIFNQDFSGVLLRATCETVDDASAEVIYFDTNSYNDRTEVGLTLIAEKFQLLSEQRIIADHPDLDQSLLSIPSLPTQERLQHELSTIQKELLRMDNRRLGVVEKRENQSSKKKLFATPQDRKFNKQLMDANRRRKR